MEYAPLAFPKFKLFDASIDWHTDRVVESKVDRPDTLITSTSRHVLFRAHSRECRFSSVFGLLLTSPPYYHPIRASSCHGIGFTGAVDQYAQQVAEILWRCSEAVANRRVCIVKTDVWYKGNLIPIGYEIASACVRRGLKLRAHWIWQRLPSYSPYSPTFANIFILGETFSRPHFSGLITNAPVKRKKQLPTSFAPEAFEVLIELLTHKEDVVLDPFAGIGGVLEASAKLGRRSVGIELSAAQCRLAVRRLRGIPGFVFNKGKGGNHPKEASSG